MKSLLLSSAFAAGMMLDSERAQMGTLIHNLGKGQNELIETAVNNMRYEDAVKTMPGHLQSLIQSGGKMTKLDDASIKKAIGILNEMIENAQGEVDSKMIECKEFHNRNRQNFEQIRTDLSRFGANLASYQKQKTNAIQAIDEAVAEIQTISEERDEKDHAYTEQKALDDAELTQRKNDLAVAEFIMEATKCPKAEADVALLSHKQGVLSCKALRGGIDSAIQKFADPVIQRKLEELMHGDSRQLAQTALRHAVNGRNFHGDQWTSFIQEKSEKKPVSFLKTRMSRGQFVGQEEVGTAPPPTEAPQTEPEPEKQARKCSLGKPNCGLLHDNMSLMWGEMKDAVDELQTAMDKAEAEHGEFMIGMNDQINALRGTKSAATSNLGEATAGINAMTDAQNEKQVELHEIEAEYKDVWGACEATLHELIYTRMCGTRKVRGEVAGQGAEISPEKVLDCEVTAFIPLECSVPCDEEMKGGTQVMHREITQMNNEFGVICPILDYTMKCNQIKCPVNCEMSMWSGWSKCSKECEGGMRTRTRTTVLEPKNGGESCDVTSEGEACNTGSCDRDCSLHEWSKPTPCSQACDKGYEEEFRHIHVKTRGQGKCPHKESQLRYKKSGCNEHACVGDEVCIAKQDVVVALDASGSLKEEGFKLMQNFTGELVKRFRGEAYENGAMKVGILQFGNGEIMEDKTIAPAEIIAPMTKDIKSLAEPISKMKWQRGFTNMAQAFTVAKTMFLNGGRPHAQSVMLVITDGAPSFKFQTREAVMELRDAGTHVNIIAVRQHEGDETKLMQEWASVPWQSHMTHIPGLLALSQDASGWVTKTIVQSCPRAESPSAIEAANTHLGFKLVAENMDCPNWWNDLGTFNSAEDCKNAAKEAEVEAFVYGVGPFDYYGGKCFAEKEAGVKCEYGWVESTFERYELIKSPTSAVPEPEDALLLAAGSQVVRKPQRPAPGSREARMMMEKFGRRH